MGVVSVIILSPRVQGQDGKARALTEAERAEYVRYQAEREKQDRVESRQESLEPRAASDTHIGNGTVASDSCEEV